jgi:hypothetical protein
VAAKKNSLVANINRRKRAGKSRSKAHSTVSRKSYGDMQQGWPKRKGGDKITKRKAGKKKTSSKKTRKKTSAGRKKSR